MALQVIPAGHGRAVRLGAGEALRIVNTHGHQVVDSFAFNASDLGEAMSMEHTRAALSRIRPRVGDAFVTNRRRPILLLEEDSSPGIHDTLIAACDPWRYATLGHVGYHRSCRDNLLEATAALALTPPMCPSPLNLWMNIPVGADGGIDWRPPVARPGDHVLLRAAMDCIVVMSACPQDLVPVNGMLPVEAHYERVG